MQVRIEDFCDAVVSEFYASSISGAMDENIDEDKLLNELSDALKIKLSIDEEFVSLNALELFSRENKGFKNAIFELVN